MERKFTPEIYAQERTEAEIENLSDEVHIRLKHINLEDGGKEILGRFIIKAEKYPLDIAGRDIIDAIEFTQESEATKRLVAEAENLAQIENKKERIDALLKLLKANVTYGYEHVLEAKAKERNIAKEELDRFGTKGNRQVQFADMLEYGIGICGQLSAGYLYLADKAQLKGMIVHSHPSYTPVNIMRTDKNEKLFKSFDVGAETSNHAWVEIQLENGEWIPVDPSTELTGTSTEGMEMFKEAGYKGNLISLVEFEAEEGSQLGQRGFQEFDGVTPAGQKDFTVDLKIGLKQRMSFGKQKATLEKRKIENGEETGKIISRKHLGSAKFVDVQFEEPPA